MERGIAASHCPALPSAWLSLQCVAGTPVPSPPTLHSVSKAEAGAKRCLAHPTLCWSWVAFAHSRGSSQALLSAPLVWGPGDHVSLCILVPQPWA